MPAQHWLCNPYEACKQFPPPGGAAAAEAAPAGCAAGPAARPGYDPAWHTVWVKLAQQPGLHQASPVRCPSSALAGPELCRGAHHMQHQAPHTHMAKQSADACRGHLRGSRALQGTRALWRLPGALHRRERGRRRGRRRVAALAAAGAVVGVGAGAGRCSLLTPAAGRRRGRLHSSAALLMSLSSCSQLWRLRIVGCCTPVRNSAAHASLRCALQSGSAVPLAAGLHSCCFASNPVAAAPPCQSKLSLFSCTGLLPSCCCALATVLAAGNPHACPNMMAIYYSFVERKRCACLWSLRLNHCAGRRRRAQRQGIPVEDVGGVARCLRRGCCLLGCHGRGAQHNRQQRKGCPDTRHCSTRACLRGLRCVSSWWQSQGMLKGDPAATTPTLCLYSLPSYTQENTIRVSHRVHLQNLPPGCNNQRSARRRQTAHQKPGSRAGPCRALLCFARSYNSVSLLRGTSVGCSHKYLISLDIAATGYVNLYDPCQ